VISISALRAALGDPALESRLAGLRDAVVEQWESATGRPWRAETDRVEIHEPEHHRTSKLWLRLAPVQSVTLVEVSHHGIDWVETDAWALTAPATLRRIAGYWAPMVRVTYSGGYTADDGSPTPSPSPSPAFPPPPADVVEALLTQARFLIQRNAGINLTVAAQAFQGASVTYHPADRHPLFTAAVRRRRRV
jgi:hypothetical protein